MNIGFQTSGLSGFTRVMMRSSRCRKRTDIQPLFT